MLLSEIVSSVLCSPLGPSGVRWRPRFLGGRFWRWGVTLPSVCVRSSTLYLVLSRSCNLCLWLCGASLHRVASGSCLWMMYEFCRWGFINLKPGSARALCLKNIKMYVNISLIILKNDPTVASQTSKFFIWYRPKNNKRVIYLQFRYALPLWFPLSS
jgi:hypothetical protein